VNYSLCRHRGSDSDTGSEASCSDGESEKSFRGYKGIESPPPNLGGSLGNNPMLECKTYMNDNDEEVEVWSYFEKSPPYTRLPLVDKVRCGCMWSCNVMLGLNYRCYISCAF
jgi:hypothetical protein